MSLATREEILRDYPRFLLSFEIFIKECLGITASRDFGFKDLTPTHSELCNFLSTGLEKTKMVLMPRYSFKSTITTIGGILWDLLRNPNMRILIYSDSASKASNFLNGIKAHIEGKSPNSRFRDYFPGWETDPKRGKWNESEIIISPRQVSFPEPSVDTGGIETSKVGKHYDKIYFDDIVSDLNVTTKEQMDKVYECYKRSLSLLKPGGDVVITGTRWAFGDPYGRIIADTEDLGKFIKAIEQGGEYPFKNIGLDESFLAEQRKKQGSFVVSCNPYEAPIIMGDWSEKPIGDVRAGDIVIGWKKRKNNRDYLIRSKVLHTGSRVSPVVKIYLESGRIIRCTHDHNWYTGRCDKTHRPYKPAKIGSYLMPFTDKMPVLDSEQKELALWLGGFYDGEGSCHNHIYIHQSHIKNPEVCKKLEYALNKLEFQWGSFISKPSKTCLGGDITSYWIKGGIQAKRKFILLCRPCKSPRIIEKMFLNPCSFWDTKDSIIDIKYDGEETVYSLQTETGNYICWGYGSKNCLYYNNPLSDEDAIFKHDYFKFYNPSSFNYNDLYITCTCDPAGEGDDFTAISVVGTDREMNMYLLDAVNAHLKPNEIVNALVRLNYKWHYTKLGVETNFFRGLLEKEIKLEVEEQRKNENWTPFSMEIFQATAKRGESKHNRIRALQPYHERGSIIFPCDGVGSIDKLKGVWQELSMQMLQYTENHRPPHDDMLDALAYQIQLIRPGGKIIKNDLPRDSIAYILKKEQDKYSEMQRHVPRAYRKYPVPFIT